MFLRHVVRVAGQKEDALETLYEQRNKKTSSQKLAEEDGLKAFDPVDVLPVKTFDGKLYYRAGNGSISCIYFSFFNLKFSK